MLSGLQALLSASAGIAPKKLQPRKSVFAVQYNHADALRLAAYMYAQDGPALGRKRARFVEGARLPWSGFFPSSWPLALAS